MTNRLAGVEPPPDVFAAVMATGVLSVAAEDHHYPGISETTGVLASLGLLVLVVVVILRRRSVRWDLHDPDVTLRLFTFVAACAVLDSRLDAFPVPVRALGLVALAAWLVLIVLTVRNMAARSWRELRDRARGAWELASVGTSGLAIAATKLARHPVDQRWLVMAVPVWVAALCLYALMTWLALWRIVAERRDRAGFEPDSWILMGGLAIATLAGTNIHALAPAWLAGPVRAVTVVTWVAASLWIPPLVYFTLHWINRSPGTLNFAGMWWAFVFPLGMYSVASYTMAGETGRPSLVTVSLVFFWDAFAAWSAMVVGGLLLSGRTLLGGRVSGSGS
ncbi:tellurite resistance/C4-dicarboxylate transporter family protein [Mycobacterium helveticum]|uniref:C4-dicarboxylate ABC transporter n=1 Tax=Mycobacterium helveticum TaxID=2592811 RepID=A0A557XDV4_9MYCO|nr:tellurite resistance/C4-dicarboxylate transporter family protein [Mycobacterium helveticum]TVS83751.1 C4-dicarboxylate ABC transporter [Mycobacterium helveticum]TVS85967.1 C4-dicarboxylate ABC transporter [Mycobacterium helveticum]